MTHSNPDKNYRENGMGRIYDTHDTHRAQEKSLHMTHTGHSEIHYKGHIHRTQGVDMTHDGSSVVKGPHRVMYHKIHLLIAESETV